MSADLYQQALVELAKAADRILRKPVPPHVLMELLDSISGRIDVIRCKAV